MKVIGIAGYSGSGKTTLIEKVIPLLVREGLRVSLIKHAHHEFDVDQPGKDSYRHRHAGCSEVLVSSSKRWAVMHELRLQGVDDIREVKLAMVETDGVVSVIRERWAEPVSKGDLDAPAAGAAPAGASA